MKKGFQRVKIDGQFHELAEAPALDKKFKHDIDVVVDRIVVRPDIASRLSRQLWRHVCTYSPTAWRSPNSPTNRCHPEETAAGGAANKSLNDTHEHVLFSEKFACPVSGFTIPEIEPRLFSFNNPFGACPTCDGLGFQQKIDTALDRARRTQTAPERRRDCALGQVLLALLRPDARSARQGLTASSWTSKWKDLPGSGAEGDPATAPARTKIKFHYADGARAYTTTKTVRGRHSQYGAPLDRETDSAWAREEIERYMNGGPLPVLQGLSPEARGAGRQGQRPAYRRGHRHVDPRRTQLVRRAAKKSSRPKQNEIAVRILKEIRERLAFLNDVGLDYLSLSRNSGTLSGGESQRIRLASQIGSGLTGVLYVLDEPSIGLHQRDNARLLDTLKHLRDHRQHRHRGRA